MSKIYKLNCIICGKDRIFKIKTDMIRHNKTGKCMDCFQKTKKGMLYNKKTNSNELRSLHTWIKKRLKKPLECYDCNLIKPLDLANISQEYKRDLNDWEWLCRSCHMKKDGRLYKLQLNHKLKVKGFVPWNKGIPMSQETKNKMLNTKRERGQIL